MADPPLEKATVKKIVRHINQMPAGRARSHTAAGPYNQAGEPDIDACIEGRCIKLEVKRRPSDKPTPLQQRTLDEWAAAGAIVGVVRSLQDATDLLAQHGLQGDTDG